MWQSRRRERGGGRLERKWSFLISVTTAWKRRVCAVAMSSALQQSTTLTVALSPYSNDENSR